MRRFVLCRRCLGMDVSEGTCTRPHAGSRHRLPRVRRGGRYRAVHSVLSKCVAWSKQRRRLEAAVGTDLSFLGVVITTIGSVRSWNAYGLLRDTYLAEGDHREGPRGGPGGKPFCYEINWGSGGYKYGDSPLTAPPWLSNRAAC